jgi:NADH dehydrogenase [ubiquinone] 1 alpha subcomplex assembly factor 6
VTRDTSDRYHGSAGAQPLSPAAELVRRHDHDRFQTALFAPAARRDALLALYAFNFEIARVRERVREPMMGHIRLEWWREAVAEAFGDGPVRRHDIVEPLGVAIREYRLSRAHFERLIEARERDLEEEPPATLAALEVYAEGSSASLLLLALEILGAEGAEAAAAAREVGIAYGLAGLLRAMRYLALTGRRVIPADTAERVGLDERDYFALRPSPPLRAAAAEIAVLAGCRLDAARCHRRMVPRVALPALLPAVIAGRALSRFENVGGDPFAPGLAAPDPLQSWRLALAALTGRY